MHTGADPAIYRVRPTIPELVASLSILTTKLSLHYSNRAMHDGTMLKCVSLLWKVYLQRREIGYGYAQGKSAKGATAQSLVHRQAGSDRERYGRQGSAGDQSRPAN